MAIKKEHISPLDLNPDIAVGLSLPLASATGGSFKLNYTTIDQAKTNLRNLLKTNYGERYMQPDFGCGVNDLLFEQNTIEIEEKIEDRINFAITKWLPYVSINTISIERYEHNIKVDMTFYINNNKWSEESITLILGQENT